MPEIKRSKQRVERFLNDIEGYTDEELARFERTITERRDCAAANVVVAPVGKTQSSNPLSCCSERSFDVHVCMEGNTEGRMDPEPGELEPLSAGTGVETP